MARNITTERRGDGMQITKKKQDVDEIHMIYKGLSEQGKIMMLAYSTAIRDKELADIGRMAERSEQAVRREGTYADVRS